MGHTQEDSPTHSIKSHRKEVNNTRLIELSKPKNSKSIWHTSFGLPLIWGNQDTMWPLSKAALKHVPSRRLSTLAKPKTDWRATSGKDLFYNQYEYSCGRESKIWTIPHSTRTSTCTERINYLAQSKHVPAGYIEQHLQGCSTSCGRESPIWRPSRSALTCSSRPRTEQLARPKTSHPLYQPSRQVQSVVKNSAKQYVATQELEALARHKQRNEGPYRDPQWIVSIGAKQAEATQRQVELSRSKRLVEGYEPSKDVIWPVTMGAKHAVASSRLGELSKPIIRDTMDHVQFNPDAFQVSPNAVKAVASARTEELAQPIQR